MRRLGIEIASFEGLTAGDLVLEIIARYEVLRYMVSQRGHARCWLDAEKLLLFFLVGLVPERRLSLPDRPRMMYLCGQFYAFRRSAIPDMENAFPGHPERLDQNLPLLGEGELREILVGLQVVTYRFVLKHLEWLEDCGPSPTLEDEREIYALLPEVPSVDFRLPPRREFLSSPERGKGCDNFWHSHVEDGRPADGHALDEWGPCSATTDR